MKCKILHESAGRIRVHLNCRRMTLHQADVLEYYLRNVDGVREVSVFDRTQDAIVVYAADRENLIQALARFSFAKAEKCNLVPEHTSRALNREFEDKLAVAVIKMLRRMGQRVPEDVQVIGYDGLRAFGDQDYYCSTIIQPVEAMAETCVELVLGETNPNTPSLLCLPVRYAYGGTTKA